MNTDMLTEYEKTPSQKERVQTVEKPGFVMAREHPCLPPGGEVPQCAHWGGRGMRAEELDAAHRNRYFPNFRPLRTSSVTALRRCRLPQRGRLCGCAAPKNDFFDNLSPLQKEGLFTQFRFSFFFVSQYMTP